MLDNLGDVAAALKSLIRRVRRLETAAPLQNAAITRGSLRVASEEGLIVQGSALVNGLLSVLGRVRIHGLGILEVLSLIDLLGSMRVRGGGAINVEAGGAIVVGNVRIQDGKILVGSSVVIDGANGKITVNGMVIDPADGGTITFPGGAQLRADIGNGIQMQIGSTKISAQGSFVQLTIGTRSITISSSGHRMSGMDTISLSSVPGGFVGAVVANSSGDLSRVVAG